MIRSRIIPTVLHTLLRWSVTGSRSSDSVGSTTKSGCLRVSWLPSRTWLPIINSYFPLSFLRRRPSVFPSGLRPSLLTTVPYVELIEHDWVVTGIPASLSWRDDYCPHHYRNESQPTCQNFPHYSREYSRTAHLMYIKRDLWVYGSTALLLLSRKSGKLHRIWEFLNPCVLVEWASFSDGRFAPQNTRQSELIQTNGNCSGWSRLRDCWYRNKYCKYKNIIDSLAVFSSDSFRLLVHHFHETLYCLKVDARVAMVRCLCFLGMTCRGLTSGNRRFLLINW